jgi:Domain of unknown function (DUF3883)
MPANQPVLLAHVVWMEAYKGELLGLDPGSWNHPDAGNPAAWYERFNFKPERGRYLGSIFHWKGGRFAKLDLKRLGAPSTVDEIDGVTVIWTAKHSKTGNRVVVGWFKNATVFSLPKISDTGRKYYCVASIADSIVLPFRQRTQIVPTAQSDGKGFPGQSSVFYVSDSNGRLARTLLRYVGSYDPTKERKPPKNGSRQIDPQTRAAVERAAMEAVAEYFGNLGWVIEDVSKECYGWDVEATKDSLRLLVEVKGLSGQNIDIELTPNEYTQMNTHRAGVKSRRSCVCVVTNSLTDPVVHAFLFDGKAWKCDISGLTLALEDRTGARGRAN